MMQAGTEKPRFRQDLFAEAVDEEGVKFIDVMDPDSGNAIRLFESEFSIACGMDGERDVAGLVQWAQDELGMKASANEVRTVIATLGQLGYLDMAGAARAAASDVPAVTPAATSGLAAAGAPPADTVVDVPAAAKPAAAAAAAKPAAAAGAAKPAAAAATPQKPAAAAAKPAQPPGAISEVSIDLSEHLAVGKEDVKEAVRQSRVMSAIELPAEMGGGPAEKPAAAPSRPPERPTPRPMPAERPAAKQPERPVAVEAKQPERPVAVEAKQPERPVAVEAKQPERPVAVEVKQPERPVEVKQPERPVEAKQPERPIEAKPPVELPKVPEKQPVTPPGPQRRVSPVLIVVILLVLGGAAFAVWKFVLSAPAEKAPPVSVAPPTPAPPPEPPKPAAPPSVTAKVEVNAGAAKTILAVFPGTIEWIEANDKDAKSGDVIVKMAGYRPLEAQISVLKKEAGKLQNELDDAITARDTATGADEATTKKLQAKAAAAEKAANEKAEQLLRKTEQIEKLYVRLTLDGKLTTLKKVGEKLPENTPVASVQPPPMASATFKVPPAMRIEVGLTTALRLGEKLLTCEVVESEEEKLRIICPNEPDFVEGAPVSWQLPEFKRPN
ncbi:MAG TPA: hypothetical protein VNO30_44880 [Kofleriaceae bacterium]|nr:hypothetical protein [Kofleriaceae bacterium]